MDKKRKAFYEIETQLGLNNTLIDCSVVILVGLRKTGKTTIMKQLSEKYNGHYINLKQSKNIEDDFLNALEESNNLILIDEITQLSDFDECLSNINNELCESGNKKLVISGSCYWALKDLHLGLLGAGRSRLVELFPLDFEEYLFFSNKIEKYDYNYLPTSEDFINYLYLNNIPKGLKILLDKTYLQCVFKDSQIAEDNHSYSTNPLHIENQYILDVLNIIAYTLNTRLTIKRLTMVKPVGKQEYGNTKLPPFESLMHISNQRVHILEPAITSKILAFLLDNGFCFIDKADTETYSQGTDNIYGQLVEVKTRKDLDEILKKYVISAISPLLYTRLMIDIETHIGKFHTNESLMGQLYELAVKSEDVYRKGFYITHSSSKITLHRNEVELFTNHKSVILLLEATITDKGETENHTISLFENHEVIRVLTCSEDQDYEFNGIYHRIPYPQALLMLSNKTIFDLEPTKIEESKGLDLF